MPARIPPNAPDAERSVLGSILTSENALFSAVERLKEDDFYRVEHRKIFRAILRLFERKSTVDPITLTDELEREGILDEIGGPSYITSLLDSVISPSLMPEHAGLVLEKSVYRRVIEASDDVLAEAYREEKDSDELLDWAEQRILEIRRGRQRRGFSQLGEVAEDVFGQIDAAMSDKTATVGTKTGFTDIDSLLVGLRDGNLIILASRPAVGKTSLMLNFHRHVSVEQGIPSAIFSLEMSREQLAMRFLSLEARVDGQKLLTGKLSREDIRSLTRAVSTLKNVPIFLDDTPAISLSEIRAKSRSIVKEENIHLISVDYMQLVQAPRADTRQQEVSVISQGFKALARELNLPLLVLSQLSRNPEHRDDKTPRLSDLRESGSIEQDADIVMFLHSQELYESSPLTRNRLDVIVAKNRNGPTGRKSLTFFREFTRFEDLAREDMVEAEGFSEDLAF